MAVLIGCYFQVAVLEIMKEYSKPSGKSNESTTDGKRYLFKKKTYRYRYLYLRRTERFESMFITKYAYKM